MPTIKAPICIEHTRSDRRFLIAGDGKLLLSTSDSTELTLNEIVLAFNGKRAATLFFQELLDSVESLTAIAEENGARTLADLMYLQSAILDGGFIDYYPGKSKVLEIASALPSGRAWVGFIKKEHVLETA